LFVAGRVFIAWAKPVPVNPMNFSNYRRDDILVSVVGPFSNLALALVCSVAVIVLGKVGGFAVDPDPSLASEGMTFLVRMFYGGIYLNVVLAIFNLLPIPPLDGSHVLATVLPNGLAEAYRRVGFLGIFLIIFLMQVPAFRSMFNSIVGLVLLPFEMLIRLFF
jgi:Zn-dependent protease